MAPIRAALVGYGLAGKVFHAPLLQVVNGVELAAVVSSDPAKVRADLPNVAVVAAMDEILADSAIDLIVLATPDHLHAGQAIAALDAGKHVVIDKPFAVTIEDARKVIERAERHAGHVFVFHNRRWDADFLTLQSLVAAGELGEVMHFESHFDRMRLEAGERWKDKRTGGVWQDLGPHLVDQALHLLGTPEAVWADIAIQKKGGHAPDYAHVVLRYAQTRAVLHLSQLAPDHRLRFLVHGKNGSYVKQGLDVQEEQSKSGIAPHEASWGIDPIEGTLTCTDGSTRAITNQRGRYQAFYENVRDCLRGSAVPDVPPDHALAVMEILQAAQESARERREIPILAK
ncbi:oxidoreductase [Novosphingobium pentaromativorans]|uniref:Oxidoreductase domain-containing protein n=1 Tax=Novosphingobium pentaromativorans US6-1 TaxID=1088721 RepID=G6EGZ5_9SPHN|nr:oxidoreductase [Novosphingobium pentaromativorans]AIT82017.1 hypothetical protein JI59_20935 [Novosphingobium pentaromativorans US6-1]EHJ59284.1 oxidoreductase domain-containing protein [Novosphingobium pentaromativorans US6-1]